MNKSIFTNPLDTSKVADPAALVSIYGIELRKCEDLLVMGYAYSNGVKLEDRVKELTESIALLEKKLGKRERVQ